MLVELVRESISDAEQRKAAVELEIETLREIEGLAEKLNGGGTVPRPSPAVQASGPATPSRNTQPPADPPKRSRAPRSAPKAPQRSSTGRRATRSKRAGSPESASAVDGRRSNNYNAAEVLEKARTVFASATEPISVAEVTRRVGFGDRNDRALTAVRQAVLDLLGEKLIVNTGNGRGGHPRYACVDKAPAADGQSGGELVDRILKTLEVHGGRMPRLDLKERVGDPGFDELNSALDLLLAEKKVSRVQAGGVAGYELTN